MKKRLGWAIALPFLGVIPVVVISILEPQIRTSWGESAWTTMFVISMILVFGLSIFPFLGFFKSMFGGKGYGFFWGNGKLARQILASGTDAKATIISIGENSQGGVVTINDQPLLNLVLRIDNNYDPEYDVSIDTVIPRSAVPQFQPGFSLTSKLIKPIKTMLFLTQPGAGSSATRPKSPPTAGKTGQKATASYWNNRA